MVRPDQAQGTLGARIAAEQKLYGARNHDLGPGESIREQLGAPWVERLVRSAGEAEG